ncbi:hypothetical protein, partial [Salinibaculum salinum]|uniref:hypothetical protein n=1 Tax=Salinibaculum salinum TaxID=3131996 RepID=UPI0030ED5378
HIQKLAYQLTYTAKDLNKFSDETRFTDGPYQFDGGDQFSRDNIRYELEAVIAHIYGIEEDDIDRIFQAFPQIRDQDVEEHGFYRTKRKVKEKFSQMHAKLTKGNSE